MNLLGKAAADIQSWEDKVATDELEAAGLA